MNKMGNIVAFTCRCCKKPLLNRWEMEWTKCTRREQKWMRHDLSWIYRILYNNMNNAHSIRNSIFSTKNIEIHREIWIKRFNIDCIFCARKKIEAECLESLSKRMSSKFLKRNVFKVFHECLECFHKILEIDGRTKSWPKLHSFFTVLDEKYIFWGVETAKINFIRTEKKRCNWLSI